MKTKTRTTFTPGPWGIEQTECTNWIGPMRRSGDGKVETVVCHIDREDLLAEVLVEADATARLIAAAPDLLAALKQAKKIAAPWIDGAMRRGDPQRRATLTFAEWDALIAQIDDAIAKAEGVC